jgi:hypothetical protein
MSTVMTATKAITVTNATPFDLVEGDAVTMRELWGSA